MIIRTAMITVCIALAGSAGAESTEMNQGHLSALDADSDGAVSSDEFSSFVTHSFKTMDADSNGSLSGNETSPYISAEYFGQIDKSGNGAISVDEFSQAMSADFNAADKDGDGALN